MTPLAVHPLPGIGEIRPGDDLPALLAGALGPAGLPAADGDVLVVTSKVVSKAEGRLVDAPAPGDRSEAVAAETDRVVARRGPTTISRTRHGLVLAAAGVDASNVEPGRLVLLPERPDASARLLRERLCALTGALLAVVVSDTAGRAWRTGQTDIAIGVAGLAPLDDHAGRVDAYGNPLAVTAPAVADEVAGAADLAAGKLSGCPAALVRGLGHLVLPRDDHGPGAAALVRPEAEDLFGLGAREAVLSALGADQAGARRGFGAPAAVDELAAALRSVLGEAARLAPDEPEAAYDASYDAAYPVTLGLPALEPVALGRAQVVVEALATAHGWRVRWDDRTGRYASLAPAPSVHFP